MKEEFNKAFFLNRGVVFMEGEIDDTLSTTVVKELLYLSEQGFSTISMCINSVGGSVSAGFLIHDTIKLIEKKGISVRGICCGICASMAAFILASCTIRETTINSEAMIHQPFGGIQGKTSDMRTAWEHMLNTNARYEKLLAEYTGKSISEIQISIATDHYLTPNEMVSFGLVDKIIETLDDVWGE